MTFPLGITRRGDPVKAYVTIIEGCNDHCAFCVVPYTRGHERMRAKADILADVREAVGSGRKEIQLLGQIVNHYQAPDDPACDFAAAAGRGERRRRASSGSASRARIRGTRRAADRGGSRPAEGLQAPAPAGAVGLDAGARRRCAGGIRARSIWIWSARIREAIPGVTLSTDMIVGFPGETAEDFERDAVADRARRDTTACSRSSTRRGRTRWRRSGCRTT